MRVACIAGATTFAARLGIGSDTPGRTQPTAIAAGDVPASVRFVDIADAGNGGCGVGDNGELYCWGDNSHTPNPSLSSTGFSPAPVGTVRGEIPPGVKLVKVALDTDNGCALGEDGKAYCWAVGALTPRVVDAGAVPAGVRLVEIQMGDHLPCALGDNGQIFCWGSGFGRRFGAGFSEFVSHSPPIAVADGGKPQSAKFLALSVGGISIASCGVADNGKTYCWGGGYRGSLGDGELGDHDALVPVAVLNGEKKASARWTTVNCATLTCTGLADNGRIYNWGANDDLMLSRNNQNGDSAVPLQISRPTRP